MGRLFCLRKHEPWSTLINRLYIHRTIKQILTLNLNNEYTFEMITKVESGGEDEGCGLISWCTISHGEVCIKHCARNNSVYKCFEINPHLRLHIIWI
jgi:hypothetical protein